MGDAGSLFLGAALSLLTMHANGQASNILSLVAIPTCILLVPILDTTLVTVTRLLRGQRISQGGRDHASHRLVILGLSEPQAVLLLYVMAIIAGASAVLIKGFSYTLSLVFLPLVLLSFTLFTAYLAQAEVVSEEEGRKKQAEKKLTVVLVTLTYKRRLLEVMLDFFVIAFAYYLAFALRFEFSLSDSLMNLYLTSLPIAVAGHLFGSFSLRYLSRPVALYRSGRSCAHRQGRGRRHRSVDDGVDFFLSLRRLFAHRFCHVWGALVSRRGGQPALFSPVWSRRRADP